MVAQHRQIGRERSVLFGHCVVVLTCMERHVDTILLTQSARPHAGGVNNKVRLDSALVGTNAGHLAIGFKDVNHPHAFNTTRAAATRTFHESHRHIDR